jgi:VanZ family protein
LLIFGINCRLEKWKIFLYSLIIGIAFAGFDEIHQSFTPGRDSDFYDFLSDLAGILMSILIFNLILKKSKLIKSK